MAGTEPAPELVQRATTAKRKFEIEGVHHAAFVCKDMARTVEFYTEVLGFPLTITSVTGDGSMQHFFFEFAPNQSIAFFWFRDAPERLPNVSNPSFGRLDSAGNYVDRISGMSAHGSLAHFAFGVKPEHLLEYRRRLVEHGVAVSGIVHHGQRHIGADGTHSAVGLCWSIYFTDPDGICLEFAAQAHTYGDWPYDAVHLPSTEHGPVDQPPLGTETLPFEFTTFDSLEPFDRPVPAL